MMPMDPSLAPDPVTPADSPSDQAGYDSVMPSGAGPAPYSIFAPLDDLTGLTQAARDLTGGQEGTSTGDGSAGFGNVMGPRQAATARLLDSPAGFSAGGGISGYDITPGWSGSPDDPLDGWPNSPQPGLQLLDTPAQGEVNGYPADQTGTD